MFGHLLGLETLGAKPDDLVSWFAWAEDIGPDGKVRRTVSLPGTGMSHVTVVDDDEV